MADLAQVESALRKAHAAGDVEGARRLANDYRTMKAQQPAEPAMEQPAQIAPQPEPQAPQKRLQLPEYQPLSRLERVMNLSGDGSAASYLKQGTRSGLQGTTLGWSDEIGAAIAAPLYKAGEKVGLLPETNQPVFVSEDGNPSLYSQMQAQSDAEQKQFAKDYPVADIAGQVGGGLIPAALTGGQTVTAQTIPQLIKAGAVQGAKYGAAYGAGSAEQGFENRLTGGAIGGAVGMVTGGVAAPIINLAGKGAGVLTNAYKEMVTRTPRQKAELLLQDVAKKAGYTPEQLAQRVTGLGKQGTLADASENMLSVADQAVSKIGTTKEAARELVKTRNKGEQADVLAVLGKQLGVNSADDLAVAIDRNAKSMQQRAAPLYEKALATDIPKSDALSRLEALPVFKEAYKQSGVYARNDLSRVRTETTKTPATFDAFGIQLTPEVNTSKYVPGKLTSTERLHYAKIALHDMEIAQAKAGNLNAAKNIADTRRSLTRVLDSVPEYKAARQIWSGGMGTQEAGDLGIQFFKMTKKPDDFISLVNELNPHDRQVAKMALLKAATDEAGSAQGNRSIARTLIGEDGNVNRKKMLAALVGDDAVAELEKNAAKWGRFRRTSSAIEGSRTAERLNTKEALDGAEAVLNPRGFVVNKLMETLTPNGRRMADPAVTNELGNILMAQGVPESEIVRLLTPAPVKQQVIGKATGQVLLPTEQVLIDRARQ